MRRYPRAENPVWSDQKDQEERGSKDRAASICGPHSDSFNDTSRRSLINSMPDRVVACIAAGGGPTRY
ncbi:hypothetical protein TNCV_4554091 [Trichonephila clavipes]|nr:hypothetical protein TNCV_4554091 [Trichonephila clavipes]